MNCKQGDLAIIVKSFAGNEGKIVRCLRYVGEAFDRDGVKMICSDYWETDTLTPTVVGKMCNLFPDSQLRPLRGDLLDDETTTSKELEAV